MRGMSLGVCWDGLRLSKVFLNVSLQELQRSLNLQSLGSSRHKHALAGTQSDGIALVVDDSSLALKADEDNEAVEFRVVERHRLVEIVDSSVEVRTLNEAHTLILLRSIFGAIVVLYIIVDALGSLLV